jgi:hypothetical protein
MAIRFTECDAFSYMGDEFIDFCRAAAAAIGVDIRRMEGFGGTNTWQSVDDAITPLLGTTHRTGSLPAEQCRSVARRLRQLARGWANGEFAKQVATELSDGMETAAYHGRPFKWYVD